jgi:galactokinase
MPETGDATRLGLLMNDSDASLRIDYEVTSRELDALTRIARSLPGCYGARMTGAGFGGCTVNLVQQAELEAFCEALLQNYAAETGIQGEVYISASAAGAGAITLLKNRLRKKSEEPYFEVCP